MTNVKGGLCESKRTGKAGKETTFPYIRDASIAGSRHYHSNDDIERYYLIRR